MKLFRSKSCVFKNKPEKQKPQPPPNQPHQNNQIQPSTQQQQRHQSRRFSLQHIKSRSRQKSSKQKAYMKVFKQRILNYIQLRSDIEIINFYQQYKQQFFRKSINLQNLLYQQPQIRHKYLSQQNLHFFKGFQQTLLNLFRKKGIVPGEFRNMRLETVEQIEKWVFSWVQRQILYERAVEQEEQAVRETLALVEEIKEYNRMVQSQPNLF